LRAGGAPPRAPKHLSKAAAIVWAEIAISKPADFFDPGARLLLETYCEVAVQARTITKRLGRLRKASAWEEMKAWEKRLTNLATTQATLATKLRLSIQALVDRHSRGLLETGQPHEKSADPLLGGRAVWSASSKAN
jgi:hypothetical protein